MESKKTFGEYVCRRRKELGMTQREFADKLYVTESAVSKWERGMSYPDVTLLRDICAALDVSEHELLTASVDTEKRTAERLAGKYLQLTRNYRIFWYIIFGGTLLGCATGNLAAQHTLDWFWIALASVLLGASLTLAPALFAVNGALEKHKWSLSLGCAAASLELLLLVCCLYTGGDWFVVAAVSVLFGLSLVLLPGILPTLPLPEALSGRKASLYLGVETALLLLLLLVCCLYTGGDWFFMAAVSVLLGLSLFFTPVFLHQLPLPKELGRHKALLYFAVETALLILLLAVASWYTGGGWLLNVGLPTAGLCLLLPWGVMAAVRYLPVSGWCKAAACFGWTGLWTWLFPWALEAVMALNGWYSGNPWRLWLPVDLSCWEASQAAINIYAIIVFSLLGMALLLAAAGGVRAAQKGRKR